MSKQSGAAVIIFLQATWVVVAGAFILAGGLANLDAWLALTLAFCMVAIPLKLIEVIVMSGMSRDDRRDVEQHMQTAKPKSFAWAMFQSGTVLLIAVVLFLMITR